MLWCVKMYKFKTALPVMRITYTFPHKELKCIKVNNRREHVVFIQSFRKVGFLPSVIMISRQHTLNFLIIFSKVNFIAISEV